ncbi:MAG: PilT/PilU family type 4a pilus ATPase [Deltaproteobacteria bacterium]
MKQLDPAIGRLLAHMLTLNASDLYLTAGSPPVYRKDGVGLSGKSPFNAEQIEAIAASLMTAEQREVFGHKLEMNLAFGTPEGRFRVNVFRQRGATGLVVRLVRSQIKTLDELGHPAALASVVLSKRGLVLVVGGTGSGKSTTLAAMIDYRNTTQTGHIVTVEDPIEYIHAHKQCVVSQREVGVDTLSYSEALKNTLRQAPDLILIGEIRDLETMEAALAFAETGHLCLSTLHANNANQALERVLNFFPSQRHHEISMQLSLNLRAIISQRLVPSTNGSRAAALEILLDTPRIKDLIKRGETDLIKDAMEQSVSDGCQTFDGALLLLCSAGRISEEQALQASDSPNNLRLLLERLGGGRAHPGEIPLRLVTSPEAQVRPQTLKLGKPSGLV